MSQKLRTSEWLISVGVVVLFAATFQKWFSAPVAETLDIVAPDAQLIGDTSLTVPLNVWDLGFTRWFVYLSLVSAAMLVVAALFGESVHYATVMATPTVLFGFISAIGLVVRLIWPPAGAEIEAAYYAAVAGSLLIFLAGCWSLRSEYVPPGYAPAPEPEHMHLDSAP